MQPYGPESCPLRSQQGRNHSKALNVGHWGKDDDDLPCSLGHFDSRTGTGPLATLIHNAGARHAYIHAATSNALEHRGTTLPGDHTSVVLVKHLIVP
jgi:hypothetical protein